MTLHLTNNDRADSFERLPPHSVESEMCLLASLIAGDATMAQELSTTLSPDDFFLTDHRILFRALRSIRADGRPVDAIILRDELKPGGMLEQIGGSAYIAQLLASVPSVAHAPEYAARVREHAAKRRVIEICDRVSRQAYDMTADAAELASQLTSGAADVVGSQTAGELIDWADLIEQSYESIGAGGAEAVRTGFRDLDHITGGIGLGETVVLAARPSMGKSTLARTIALNAASEGVPVGFISLEESPAKIGRNALVASAGVENQRVRRAADLTTEEYKRLARSATKLKPLPITVCRRSRTVEQIRQTATAMKLRKGIKLLIVDHLSRVRAPGKSIYEQMTNASGAISDLVKDLPVAGLILCQLNREVEKRADTVPTMADLRDSGAIEQDADGILLLHREDYYRVGSEGYAPSGEADLIIAKWRDGVRGRTVRVKSELQYQRFRNVASFGEELL